MFTSSTLAALVLCASSAQATVLWNGFFNSSSVVGNFDKWSFSNEIAPWQWYIHGPGATTEYLGLSSSFKNPADTSEAQGLRTTIDGTSFWNGQTMERTEVLPQTSAPINAGHVYYHFSMSTSSTNAPNPGFEHQIAFFESHFTELKYGLLSGEQGTTDNTLRWMVNQVTQWSTPLVAGTWYNFAYDIDFSAGKVGLWASQGSSPLTQVVAPMSVSASSNGADWHIGVLRLPNGGTNSAPEDYFWSGIFIESGSITTSIAGPQPGMGGTAPVSSSTPTTTVITTTPKSTSTPTTTTTITPTTTPSGCTSPKYGQCGGTGWGGCTACASGSTCKVSNPYYSQCL